MNEQAVFVLALVIFAWAVLSARLARADVSGPAAFVAAGVLFALGPLDDVELARENIKVLAELTLAVVLFSDASRVEARRLRSELSWPVRLLGIGFPLTVLAGFLAALALLDLPWELAALLAAIVAPTDAALSASLIADGRVPLRVRQSLNVESGLNDGLATPVVVFFLAASTSLLGGAEGAELGEALVDALVELALGVAVGGAVGWVGGWLALALVAYLGALLAGGNGFVAAFTAGIAFALVPDDGDDAELPEIVGELLSLTVWFVFGAVLLLPSVEHLGAGVVVYAVASLTVVRMVPVALALLGGGADRGTVLFLGWFGPRGLASVVFALLTAESLPLTDPAVETVVDAVAVTVLTGSAPGR